MNNIKERQEFENYKKIKLLGEGSFGKAFLVERASDNVPFHSIQITDEMCNEVDRHNKDVRVREERNCIRGKNLGSIEAS